MALSLEQYQYGYYEDTEIKVNLVKDILTQRIERQRKKYIGVSIKNGNKIPEDLIIEILSRLSVKALLQFKSVCKLWYDIIKSSNFISKHLRNYYDDNNNWRDCLIVQHSIIHERVVNMYELLIDDTKNRTLSYQRIKNPLDNSYLCGPCNGIYFLWRSLWNPVDKSRVERSLWNPALNELKILPDITWKPTLPVSSSYLHESYGFGYDSKTDDYKVILILDYANTWDDNSKITDNPVSILIYSLKTNSWRYWGDMENFYQLRRNKSYVFVNGCYYWLANRFLTWGGMIVCFDISAETCQEIPLPQFETHLQYESQLIVYQDSIAFVSVPDEDNTSFSIWTWNNEVWTQKLKMKLDFEVWGAFNQWRDNMLVFREARWKLVLLDTNTKEIFVLDDTQENGCENICAYKESLVSIKDFGNDVKHKGKTI